MSRKIASVEDGPPPEEAPNGPSGRRDRGLHREHMSDLKALANRLAKLSVSVRRKLPLDVEVLEQLDRLAAADPRADRRRILMRTKLLLGAVDLVRLQAAIEGDTEAAAWERASARWRTRLVAGDDAVLQSFVEAFPRADRQALRTSAREARGTGPAAARALTRLLTLVRAAHPPAGAPPEPDDI